MIRFPTRTLVLMALALLSFGWMYAQTHRPAEPPPQPLKGRLLTPARVEVQVEPAPGGDR
jgi:hypothetical protein